MMDNGKFSENDMLNACMVRQLWLKEQASVHLEDVLDCIIEFFDDIGKGDPDNIDYDRVEVAGMLRFMAAAKWKAVTDKNKYVSSIYFA